MARQDVWIIGGLTAALVVAAAATAVWITDTGSAPVTSPAITQAPKVSTSAPGSRATTTTVDTTDVPPTTVGNAGATTTRPGSGTPTPDPTVPPGGTAAPPASTPVAVAAGQILQPGDGGQFGEWRDGLTEGDYEPAYYENIAARVDVNPQQWSVWLVRRDADGGVFPEQRLAANGIGQWTATRRLFWEHEQDMTATLVLVVADPLLDAYYDSWLEQDIATLVPEGSGTELDAVSGTCCRVLRPEET